MAIAIHTALVSSCVAHPWLLGCRVCFSDAVVSVQFLQFAGSGVVVPWMISEALLKTIGKRWRDSWKLDIDLESFMNWSKVVFLVEANYIYFCKICCTWFRFSVANHIRLDFITTKYKLGWSIQIASRARFSWIRHRFLLFLLYKRI